MKKICWLVIVLLLSIGFWLSAIIISPLVAGYIVNSSSECEGKSILECKDFLSALGATGDIFGVITSLFSGLAIFAVAYTLWVDANARRESKKPLVINYLDENSIVISNPKRGDEPEFDLSLSSKVGNKNGEAALNVVVKCQIRAGDELLAELKSSLRQPLVSEGSEEVEAVIKMKGKGFSDFLDRMTQNQKPVLFQFEITYSSLENVRWETKVSYSVSCKAGDRRRRLNSLRSGTDDFDELWANGAQVALEVEVKEGSWLHQRK